ncbi:MAG: hypothetical protein P4L79_14650 [Legionella sp.]|uniref:hypothetical protein n=1 Tax=Legionella sp. TaxID=459 RepID=UPI002842E97B|nr:hypothetical protein [Legionella sp.]
MFIYIEGFIDIPRIQKTAKEQNLNPQKVVFLFPGNSSHHAKGTNLYTIKGGGGLAVPAQNLGNLGYPVLSLPTTSMEKWSTDSKQQQTVQSALADLYRAVGAGYHLLLPVRAHNNTTYFDSGLADTQGLVEPSFWGLNLTTPNKPLATHYIQELDKLAVFIQSPEEERLKTAQADSSNPFFAAYLDGLQMQEDDPWLQLPVTAKKQIPTVQPKLPETTPVVKKEEAVVARPSEKPQKKEKIIQPSSNHIKVATENPSADSKDSATLDFLMYGALFTVGFGSLAIAVLAWPVIVPALVAAEIISASAATTVAATITATGVAIAGGVAAFSFFKPSIEDPCVGGEKAENTLTLVR